MPDQYANTADLILKAATLEGLQAGTRAERATNPAIAAVVVARAAIAELVEQLIALEYSADRGGVLGALHAQLAATEPESEPAAPVLPGGWKVGDRVHRIGESWVDSWCGTVAGPVDGIPDHVRVQWDDNVPTDLPASKLEPAGERTERP